MVGEQGTPHAARRPSPAVVSRRGRRTPREMAGAPAGAARRDPRARSVRAPDERAAPGALRRRPVLRDSSHPRPALNHRRASDPRRPGDRGARDLQGAPDRPRSDARPRAQRRRHAIGRGLARHEDMKTFIHVLSAIPCPAPAQARPRASPTSGRRPRLARALLAHERAVAPDARVAARPTPPRSRARARLAAQRRPAQLARKSAAFGALIASRDLSSLPGCEVDAESRPVSSARSLRTGRIGQGARGRQRTPPAASRPQTWRPHEYAADFSYGARGGTLDVRLSEPLRRTSRPNSA